MSTVESEEKLWYVVHTYSGYENKVAANLESRIQTMGMENNIFRVIVPEDETEEVKNGKKEYKMEKTFPGYVLVEMVMSDEAWFVVRNTPGVTGFVGSHGGGSKPNPLMPEEVAKILHSQGMATQRANVEYSVGEMVLIIDGAFSQMEARVEALNKSEGKVKVSMMMFDREVTAELDLDQIDKL